MKYQRLIALAVTALCCTAGYAQEKFTIAGGGGKDQGSVYSAVIGDLAGACSTDQLQLEEMHTNGGVKNLELLLANQVKGALVPTSLLFNAKTENASRVANIKTVVPMHPEPVHLIARADAKTEGGFSAFGKNVGGKDIVFNSAEDLRGRPVGAVGGSVVDANTISNKLKYGWVVQTYPKNTDLLAALAQHKVDAALIVAGSGSATVKAIKGPFKLLPVRGNSDTAEVYLPSKIQYENLNGGAAVDTISTQALLVTRKWNSEEMNNSLAQLRTCFKKSLAKIQDTTGSDPVWQDIQAGDMGKWPLYELPNAAPVAAAAATPNEHEPSAAALGLPAKPTKKK